MSHVLRIGTRASKLAVTQAEKLRAVLLAAQPDLSLTLHPMTTAGDRDQRAKLTDWGYKGLFTKELEDALLERRIDLAVHSLKDMPSVLPEGLIIAAVLKRDDARDGWISPSIAGLEALPDGAVVGTSSLRRAAQLRHLYPDVTIVELRGNVETRLKKLQDGVAVATFLACAGLDRMGLSEHIRERIAPEIMLPAAAQGIIAIECRADDTELRALLSRISHAESFTCANAERAMLARLDGSCRTPIAGLAECHGDKIFLRAEVIAPDGSIRYQEEAEAARTDAARLGDEIGAKLRASAGHLLEHLST
jgi:hydroxymethylbilane synthase